MSVHTTWYTYQKLDTTWSRETTVKLYRQNLPNSTTLAELLCNNIIWRLLIKTYRYLFNDRLLYVLLCELRLLFNCLIFSLCRFEDALSKAARSFLRQVPKLSEVVALRRAFCCTYSDMIAPVWSIWFCSFSIAYMSCSSRSQWAFSLCKASSLLRTFSIPASLSSKWTSFFSSASVALHS